MTLIGSVGRWHGAQVEGCSKDERELRIAVRQHREHLTEWLSKRADCAVSIANHRKALARLTRQAKRRGIDL